MKTNYTDMAKRYRLAYEIVWKALAKWKQNAITEDRIDNPNSRHLAEFAKAVITLAESKQDLSLKTVDYNTTSSTAVGIPTT